MRFLSWNSAVMCLFALGLPLASRAEELVDPHAATTAAVNRAVEYLQEKGMAWKESRQCAACHHVPVMTWALHEAKRHALTVDEELLKEATDWCLLEDNTAKIFQPTPASEENPYPNPLSLATVYMALSESNGPNDAARRPMIRKFLQHIVDAQEADGSWRDFVGSRPPMFASKETLTLLLLNTLTWPDQPAELRELVAASRQKAVDWALTHREDPETQPAALRLWMLATAGRPQSEVDAALQNVLARQRADGGWSQTAERSSDAYATGQVLYALQSAGLSAQHESLQRGVHFLVKTQGKNGAWDMISRPMNPALIFAVSAVTREQVEIGRAANPESAAGARNTEPISFTATAWATVALCRTLPR